MKTNPRPNETPKICDQPLNSELTSAKPSSRNPIPSQILGVNKFGGAAESTSGEWQFVEPLETAGTTILHRSFKICSTHIRHPGLFDPTPPLAMQNNPSRQVSWSDKKTRYHHGSHFTARLVTDFVSWWHNCTPLPFALSSFLLTCWHRPPFSAAMQPHILDASFLLRHALSKPFHCRKCKAPLVLIGESSILEWNDKLYRAGGFHIETLIIYKLSSRKFTTLNDLY